MAVGLITTTWLVVVFVAYTRCPSAETAIPLNCPEPVLTVVITLLLAVLITDTPPLPAT